GNSDWPFFGDAFEGQSTPDHDIRLGVNLSTSFAKTGIHLAEPHVCFHGTTHPILRFLGFVICHRCCLCCSLFVLGAKVISQHPRITQERLWNCWRKNTTWVTECQAWRWVFEQHPDRFLSGVPSIESLRLDTYKFPVRGVLSCEELIRSFMERREKQPLRLQEEPFARRSSRLWLFRGG